MYGSSVAVEDESGINILARECHVQRGEEYAQVLILRNSVPDEYVSHAELHGKEMEIRISMTQKKHKNEQGTY